MINKIEQVLNSKLLSKGLTVVPSSGASKEEMTKEERFLKRSLSEQYKNLLNKWNGIDLDVIRLYGCNEPDDTLDCLRNNQELLPPSIKGGIVIGSDPMGFMYIENINGIIYSLDTDGGEILKVASSLEDLICNYLFGNRAQEFGGEEWVEELKVNGII